MSKTTTRTDRFASVWDALAESTEQATNTKVRADLMRKIATLVQDRGWTQAVAAGQCGIGQPRLNDLLRGRIGCFPLDALMSIAATLGQQVHVEPEATWPLAREPTGTDVRSSIGFEPNGLQSLDDQAAAVGKHFPCSRG